MEREVVRLASASTLFRGLEEKALAALLTALDARCEAVPSGRYMLFEGDDNSDVSVVLEGRAVGERTGAEGRVTTVSEFGAGDAFGDVLSGASVKSPVTVRAVTDCRVLRFSFDSLFRSGQAESRAVLMRNLIAAISDKYFALNRRILVLTGPTLRSKAARYLRELTGNFARLTVWDGRTREAQARYLGCDRSALSRELAWMKRQGYLDYSGGRFHILDAEALVQLAEL